MLCRSTEHCTFSKTSLVWSPPSKKPFHIHFCGSPVFEKRCKQTDFSNYSCNYSTGIQNPVNTGKSTWLSQLTVMVSGWNSCSSFPECTVTTAMGNCIVLLNFNPLLVNSSLKCHQEWQYLAMAELQWDEGEWLNMWLTENTIACF